MGFFSCVFVCVCVLFCVFLFRCMFFLGALKFGFDDMCVCFFNVLV